MTETFCDSGAVKLKAGANATVLTATQYTQLINQAESFINDAISEDGVDLVDIYTTLNANTRKILQDAASSHAAIGAINYDLDALGSLSTAQTMLDVNYARFTDCLGQLKNKKVSDFMRGV